MEQQQINLDSFELLVKALGRAAAKPKPGEAEKREAQAEKILISGQLQDRISRVITSLNHVFDESDRRFLYAKQRLYELKEMPGVYETEISDWLTRIENAINSYINEKKAREERIKKLEENILKRVKKQRLKKEISKVVSKLTEKDRVYDKLLVLKRKYYKLLRQEQTPEVIAQLEIIKKRIERIQEALSRSEKCQT